MEIKVHAPVLSQWPAARAGRVAIIGEFPDENSALKGEPLVGASGNVLGRALDDAGIARSQCLVGNVFERRPPGNDVQFFFVKKVQAKKLGLDKTSPVGPFGSRGYVSEEYQDSLLRLKEELLAFKPNVVLALGPCALWALTGQDKIGSYRGTVMESTLIPGQKVIATYAPDSVIRSWKLLPIFVADIRKTKTQSMFPEIKRTVREILVEPSLGDIEWFLHSHIKPLEGGSAPLAYDIETVPGCITCIGFAPSDKITLVVPFMDKRRHNWSYWHTLGEEQSAWKLVRDILDTPGIPKVTQNGMYDVQYLLRHYKIKVRGLPEDTMLMHHALQPELPKSLGFLGSLYSDEPAWKQLVKFTAEDKKDA